MVWTMTNTQTTTCFHVTTSRGNVYGVAATCQTDAMRLASERMLADEATDVPVSARRVGRWVAPWGTVLAY